MQLPDILSFNPARRAAWVADERARFHPYCLRRCPVLASPLLWAGSLPVPADAKVVDQRPAVEQERVYPMGPLRKISGRLRVEDKVESRGQVSSVTYEPVERSAREAFTSAREALQRDGGYPLFWCQGRDCGEAACGPTSVRQCPAERWRRATGVHPAAPLGRGGRHPGCAVQRHPWQPPRLPACGRIRRQQPAGRAAPTAATVLREMRDTGKLDYPDLAEPRDTWVTLLARSLNLDSTLRASLEWRSGRPGASNWSRQACVMDGSKSALRRPMACTWN
jgi:hypothetical protein